MQVRIYFKLKDNKNITAKLGNIPKAIIKEKFTALNAMLEKYWDRWSKLSN